MKYDNLEHNDMDPNLGERMYNAFSGDNNAFSRTNKNEISELIIDLGLGYCLNSLYGAYTPLMYASELNCVKAVELLLNEEEVRQEIDYTNRDRSALTIAAQFGCFDIAKLLVKNGATITAAAKNAARKNNYLEIVNFLENPGPLDEIRVETASSCAIL